MKPRHSQEEVEASYPRNFAPTASPFAGVPAFDPESGSLNVIIDTPKGSRNKYALDPATGLSS